MIKEEKLCKPQCLDYFQLCYPKLYILSHSHFEAHVKPMVSSETIT